MLKKIGLSLSLLLVFSAVFVSVAPALPPVPTIQPDNFDENGPISGTNVRVRLEVTGSFPLWPHLVHAVLNGVLNDRVLCIPDPGYGVDREDTIRTNFEGKWAGIVVIASTGWDDGSGGGLQIRIAALARQSAKDGRRHTVSRIPGLRSSS